MNDNYIKKLNILMTISLWVLGIGLLLFFFIRIINYAWPSGLERGNFIEMIFSFFRLLFGEMIKGVLRTYNYISKNYFKSGLVLFFTLYLLVTIFAYPTGPLFKSGTFDFNTKTGNAGFDSHSGFLLFTNITWCVLGIALALGLFNVTLKNWSTRNPYPSTASFSNRLNWTFKKSLFDLKVFTSGVVIFGLMLGLLYIISKYQVISLSMSVLLQIFSAMALLFIVYKWAMNNPTITRYLATNNIFKNIFHFIFAIPAFVRFIVNSIHGDIESTPSVVWVVFLGEIIALLSYFIIPIIKNKFYTTNFTPKNNSLTIKQAEAGIISGITSVERDISSIKQQLNINWDTVIKQKLYKNKNDDELTKFLKNNNFKEHYNKSNKLASVIKSIFIYPPTMTLSAAKTFIIVNTPLLMDKITEKKKLENEKDDFLQNSSEIFQSKILLNKPVYTDNLKILGSFENFKKDLGEYNYQYSFSCWVFLHEQPPSKSYANTKFTSIVNYGNKPNILFNASKGILQITNQNKQHDTEVLFQTNTIPLQKWNNIVINYEGGTLDVFINKKLVASKPNIIPYMSHDLVTSGYKDGVSGGICSVVYYSGPLSKRQIEFFYDTLKNKNPPVV